MTWAPGCIELDEFSPAVFLQLVEALIFSIGPTAMAEVPWIFCFTFLLDEEIVYNFLSYLAF